MTDDDAVLPPSPPETAQPVPAPPQYTIFRGPNGTRAGWRALLFLAFCAAQLFVFAIALFLLSRLGGGLPGAGSRPMLTPLGTVISSGGIFLIATLSALLMSRIERRDFSVYGLPPRLAFRKHFWIGTLAGFAAISVCLLGIFAFHGFRLSGVAIHGTTLIAATAAWSAAFVVVGLSEEFAFRGYLQYTLTTGIGFWPSAAVMSVLFGAAHLGNPGETVFGLSSVVLFGLLFCLFLRRTGNLWWAVGFHAGWDWGQTFFYGVPDSGMPAYHSLFGSTLSGPSWLTGGTVGPEASIFAPIALLIVAALFSRAYPANLPAQKLHTAAASPTTS